MDYEKELKEALNLNHVKECASEETNQKIREKILNARTGRKRTVRKTQWRMATAAAAVLLLTCIWQFPAVKAVSMKALEYFTVSISFSGKDTKESLSWEEAYVSIPEKAPKEGCIMDTMQEAREVTGMDFLKSKYEFQGERPVMYTAYVSSGGTLNGFMVIDEFYVTGDLGNLSVGDWWTEDDGTLTREISSYHDGKEYKSPVMMQILVRSDQDEGVDYQEYAGVDIDYTESDSSADVEIISLDNLGVNAVLATVFTDGPVQWAKEETAPNTHAFFTYKGVEYTLMGQVSRETMKEILDTLK